MSLNGSGTWNLTAGQPVQSGTLITVATFNALVADIQATFNTALYKDGQQTATANQPMGTYKHTGVGDATARTQYASAGQVQDGVLQYLTSVSGTNTITAGASLTLAAYAAGQRFSFIVGTTNTGAVTLNVSALGAKSVTKKMSGGKVALVVNDLIANQSAEVFYDGTDFILETARTYSQGANVASANTINLDTTTGDLIDVTGTTAITAITLAQGEQRTVRFTDVLTLTHNSVIILQTGASITTAAGDYAVFRGYASGVVRCVAYSRASGAALTSNSTSATLTTPTVNGAVAGTSLATQAEMETGTATDKLVTPGVVAFHPGTAKAWCVFDGTVGVGAITVPAAQKYNITSVTKNGGGDYTIVVTTAFSTAQYACIAMASNSTNPVFCFVAVATTPTATTIRVNVRDDTGTAANSDRVSVVMFGDQ